MLGRRVLQSLLLVFCLCALFPLFAKKPSAHNPPQPAELKNYHDSGKYLAEVSQKVKEAQEYLDSQIRYARKGRLAIVLDIDETALSNYAALEKMQFAQNGQILANTYLLGQATPIDPVLNLYQHALKNNIAVFFVSSRPQTPEMMEATAQNLKAAGFTQWQDLVLMPTDKPFTIADFKAHTRGHISAQGYEILLNISSHEADLLGGYAEIRVKLPNPFYTLA